MWIAVITAVLDWLYGIWREQSHTTGVDLPTKPGLRESLNKRLDEWKSKQKVKP